MPQYAIYGELTYANGGTASTRRTAMQTVLSNHPNVQGWNGSIFTSGIGGSGSTVTISLIAPDESTMQAFRDDLRPEWSASTRNAGYISTVIVGDG